MTKQMSLVAKLTAVLATLVLSIGAAFAQNHPINGTVVDGQNLPVIGASVIVVGNSTIGTVTDLDGKYVLNVPAGSSVEVSCIGYKSQVIATDGKNTIDVVLVEDSEFLEETVVIGYGVQKKSDLTGSVASVREDDLRNRSTSDAAAALQGKAAGVQVITNNGAPGTGSEIRVRGVSSNSGDIGPLLIVDGLKVDNIQYLDPSMIESMEILKDAASAAIYGAQAGNGVVLITTRSGKNSAGQGKVFYNGQFSLNSLSRNFATMNAQEYIEFEKACGYLSDAMLSVYDGKTDIDWAKEVFVPTWSNTHTVGVQGGNERGSYFVSINNVYNNGIFVGDKDVYKRLTFQVNADYKIKDWLTVGTNNSIEKWGTQGVSQQDDNGSALLAVINSSPLFALSCSHDELPADVLQKEAEGYNVIEDPYNPGQYWVGAKIGNTQSGHPFVQRDRAETTNGGFTVRGVAYANLMPIKGLTITSRFGYRISQSNYHQYAPKFYSTSTIKSDTYSLTATANTGLFYQWENFANYNRTFGKHAVLAMAGMSFIEESWDNVSVTATGSDILKDYADNFHYIDCLLPTDQVAKTVKNAPGKSASLSYFGRLGYTYDNRYSVQANFRADAFDTSKLPADKKRWGLFPSVSAGWTVSNESFIKDNVSRDVLSFLKVRGSWGINGNINVLKNYPYSSSILVNSTFYQYTPGSTAASLGSAPAGIANPNLTWETSEQVDLGIDARLFSDRLTVGLDFFNKNTKDLLVGISPVKEMGGTPAFEIGMGNTVTTNAGKVNNKGFEVELGWKDSIGDLHYSVNANASWLHNEVTYLEPTVGRIPGRVPQGTECGTHFEQGYPVWYILGYEAVKVNSEGRTVYLDANGEETTSPAQADRKMLGSSIPNFIYGITINLEYKGFDLTVFGNGVAGNSIFPSSWRPDRKECNTYAYYWQNSWKKAGDEAWAKFPAAQYWDTPVFSSSFSVFDGSYFKIKQIQLGYTLPNNITKKFAVSNLRVFASLDNFITFSKYIGLDPETATTSGNAVGIDMGTYPTAKSMIFGVNLEF